MHGSQLPLVSVSPWRPASSTPTLCLRTHFGTFLLPTTLPDPEVDWCLITCMLLRMDVLTHELSRLLRSESSTG